MVGLKITWFDTGNWIFQIIFGKPWFLVVTQVVTQFGIHRVLIDLLKDPVSRVYD